ncbi:hypothetical protein [Nocardia sp. NPDC055049]
MPTALTVVTAVEQRAVAVLVSALKHLGGTEKEKAVALACDVVAPRETVRRTSEPRR